MQDDPDNADNLFIEMGGTPWGDLVAIHCTNGECDREGEIRYEPGINRDNEYADYIIRKLENFTSRLTIFAVPAENN
ncbi:hypothetical protein [Streptomyces goshikiensis]